MSVYFVSNEDRTRVKIGNTTREIKYRLAELQSHSPDILSVELVINHDILGTKRHECRLHRIYAQYNIHSEWFYYTCEIENLIKWYRSLLSDDEAIKAAALKRIEGMPDITSIPENCAPKIYGSVKIAPRIDRGKYIRKSVLEPKNTLSEKDLELIDKLLKMR